MQFLNSTNLTSTHTHTHRLRDSRIQTECVCVNVRLMKDNEFILKCFFQNNKNQLKQNQRQH